MSGDIIALYRAKLAAEKGTIIKDWGGRLSIALIYPNAYRLGMTNLGFQIVYGRPLDPHALTWWRNSGFYHHRVDDGERPDTIAQKGTPVLLPDGRFEPSAVGAAFDALSEDIDPRVASFVRDTISRYPG